ncbi:MAG: heavy-metal-associated domain-containing protein, partial [Candidatus Cloacimonetes bacterium]|nr:heavy-metal-associated domain-containing protein [Candidatus Cloacimonadota bacterium]
MKKSITIGIDGMHCASCSASVEKALVNTKGVISANVNLPLEEASIDFEDSIISPEKLNQVITDTGFSIRETPLSEDESEQEDIYIKA